MKKREPTVYEKESAKRIRQLIEERCDGSQQEFANKVGIGKASVSQYVNETNFPNNKTCGKIAAAFNVSPMWVMGFGESDYSTSIKSDTNLEHQDPSTVPTDGQSTGYYLDPETARIAQAMFDDPQMRSLFHMKRSMDPDSFKAHYDMMKKMYLLEHPEDADDFEGC